jgi:hypothetical protein
MSGITDTISGGVEAASKAGLLKGKFGQIVKSVGV